MNDLDHDAIVELLPGYALGALDPADARAVEGYLAAHPEARREVEDARETLGLLALAAPPLAPPPGAKAALLARIEQLTPPASGGQASSPGGVRLVAPESPGPIPLRRPEAGAARPDRRWRAALAAVAAALILALAGWNVALQRQIGTVQGQVSALRGDLGAQAETVALGRLVNDQRFARPLASSAAEGGYSATGGPAGYLYADPGGTLGLVNCYWMPNLQPGQVYQVWLVRADGGRDNGGTFTVDKRGSASVVIHAPASFTGYTSVGVTAEPAPGSAGPTTPRVVWADLN